MYKFLKGLINVLSHIFFRVKINGKDNIPKEGQAIICGNHINALDSVFLVCCTKRKIHFMAKKVLFKHWFMRFIQKPFSLIPVDREKQDITAIKESLRVLKNGEILGIFPEGTRNGMAKNVEIKNGVSFFALKTGAKVIPVGIRGSFKLFSKVIYNIGEPLIFSGDVKNKNDLDNTTNIIMSNIIELTNK